MLFAVTVFLCGVLCVVRALGGSRQSTRTTEDTASTEISQRVLDLRDYPDESNASPLFAAVFRIH